MSGFNLQLHRSLPQGAQTRCTGASLASASVPPSPTPRPQQSPHTHTSPCHVTRSWHNVCIPPPTARSPRFQPAPPPRRDVNPRKAPRAPAGSHSHSWHFKTQQGRAHPAASERSRLPLMSAGFKQVGFRQDRGLFSSQRRGSALLAR